VSLNTNNTKLLKLLLTKTKVGENFLICLFLLDPTQLAKQEEENRAFLFLLDKVSYVEEK
jgi:hypothetical protein